ncbi:hypothetical protein J6590_107293 [Homalodisca vitripennis]|nr:hypothetical protein J6590_107293 [Homalodisca vitripennis]
MLFKTLMYKTIIEEVNVTLDLKLVYWRFPPHYHKLLAQSYLIDYLMPYNQLPSLRASKAAEGVPCQQYALYGWRVSDKWQRSGVVGNNPTYPCSGTI